MRVPPHDNDAEQSVLGSILIDREALAIVRDVLVPEDFYAERHAVLYRAALALDDRGEAIDTVTLRDQLERGPGIGTRRRHGLHRRAHAGGAELRERQALRGHRHRACAPPPPHRRPAEG